MPLLSKRNKPLIPPVESERQSDRSSVASTGPPPSYRSNASTYVASRDGDLYSSRSGSSRSSVPQAGGDQEDHDTYGYRDKYSRSQGVGDVYSRGDAQLDRDRNELFSGYNPKKAGSGRFFDGPEVGDGEEEDVEAIKTQTRNLKQESVNSTRNALLMARQAEETARGTLEKLGSQSERLANTERHLDVSKGHSARAEDATDELKQLNKSIFRPVITFNKDKKRRAAEARVQARYDEERDEREKAMMDVRETQNRVGRAQTYGRYGDDDDEALTGTGSGSGVRAKFKSQEQLEQRKQQRQRYQFEATASDDEMEDELDDNLDEIGEAAGRLKQLGLAMNSELDAQNNRLDNLGNKTDKLDLRLASVSNRQKRIK